MSHEPDPLDAGLKAVEAALGAMAPARSRIDRDRVMFRAGQAAAGRSASGRRPWMAAASVLACVAFGEALLIAHRPPPGVVERLVVVHDPVSAVVPGPAEVVPAPAPASAAWRPPGDSPGLGQSDYERISSQVIRYGLDGLPGPSPTGGAGRQTARAFSRQSLQEELRKDLDMGDPS